MGSHAPCLGELNAGMAGHTGLQGVVETMAGGRAAMCRLGRRSGWGFGLMSSLPGRAPPMSPLSPHKMAQPTTTQTEYTPSSRFTWGKNNGAWGWVGGGWEGNGALGKGNLGRGGHSMYNGGRGRWGSVKLVAWKPVLGRFGA